MTGGISAIRGFDFQATVILDLLLAHFEQFGAAASVRPEGTDDLDLLDDRGNQTFVQIKKRQEESGGAATGHVWSLNEAVDEFLPQTLGHLRGNAHRQRWVLGDEVSEELRALVDSTTSVPAQLGSLLKAAHLLARKGTLNLASLNSASKRLLERWEWSGQVAETHELESAVTEMAYAYGTEAEERGVAPEDTAAYASAVSRIAVELESAVTRIELHAGVGQEHEVARRVTAALQAKLTASADVVEATLFRNLRGFVSDVSKVPGLRFNKAAFEDELVSVWPRMIPVRLAPVPDTGFIARPSLASRLAETGGGVLEVLGPSGAGKTSLAGDAARAFEALGASGLAYYVEAERAVSVRDIVAGLAFRLRRFGDFSDIGVMLNGRSSTEQAIASFATAIAALRRPVCAFVDFVAGVSDDQTGADLAKLALQVAGVTPNFRLVVLAQETPFRNLSDFDRQAKQIQSLALPGLTLPEFEALLELNGTVVDRQVRYDVFMRVTAGRQSGLLAKLAMSLAKAGSVPDMQALAALPPESMLESADQNRFFRILEALRPAAGMLTCFALPFSRSDAVEAFTGAPVGGAIAAMRDLGLLRRRDELTFEMHESVRVGLEASLAADARRQAHADLARWYASRADVPAEVLHLRQAGRRDEAKARARESFLAGANWPSLVEYVRDNRLLSGLEAAQLLVACDDVPDAYSLIWLFDGLDDEQAAQILLTRFSTPSTPRGSDQYSLLILFARAILKVLPQAMSRLIGLALRRSTDDSHGHDTKLSAAQIALGQAGVALDAATVALFSTGDHGQKTRLLPVLLQDGRPSSLSLALAFISTHPTSLHPRTQANWSVADALRLNTSAGVQAFLAAIPPKPTHELLLHRAPLLHALTPLIWPNRDALRRYVPDALRDEQVGQVARQNAIRVLAALADERTVVLADALPHGPDAPSIVAKVLMPWLVDLQATERTLLDVHADFNDRVGCLIVLGSVGAPLGRLMRLLEAGEPERARAWQTVILPMCAKYPFQEAVPLVKARLDEDPNFVHGASIVFGLGSLTSPEVAELLAWTLRGTTAYTRLSSARALAGQRASRALPGLELAAQTEIDQPIGANIVAAMVASHPTNCTAVNAACERFPAAAHWRFVLAGRLAAESMADEIVVASISSTTNWRVRRAAILAAGRLPFDLSLARIVAPLLAERSTYLDDLSGGLRSHHALTFLLSKGVTTMFSSFVSSRDEFIGFMSPLVDQVGRHDLFPDGAPSSSHAAAWVYDRLLETGYPGEPKALEQVVSELHVPVLQAALLRSLRLSGRVDVVVSTLEAASTLWLAIRCIIEAFRMRIADHAFCDMVEAAASRSPFRGNSFFDGVLQESLGARRRGLAATETSPAPTPQPATQQQQQLNPRVSSARALEALSDASVTIEINAPLVVVGDSDESLQRLALALSPVGDHTPYAVDGPPSLRLTGAGFSVGDARTSLNDNRSSLRAALRPAVAAASTSQARISWHEPLLRGHSGHRYALLFLEALIAKSDRERFFDALAEAEDVLVPLMFQSDTMATKVSRYADPRLLGIVLKYQAAGDDDFFNGMCQVLLAFAGPEVDPALAAMLSRWMSRFDLNQRFTVQQDNNHGLWRGFSRLGEHPRFTSIPEWDKAVQQVAELEISEHRRTGLMRALERSPRTYVFLETTLSKTSNFVHARWDEVDRLDDAAQRLFREET
jgi:hypothetical protein